MYGRAEYGAERYGGSLPPFVFTRTATEMLATSDAVILGQRDSPRTITEALPTSDAVTRAAVLTRRISETLSTADAVTREHRAGGALSDLTTIPAVTPDLATTPALAPNASAVPALAPDPAATPSLTPDLTTTPDEGARP